ncbi:pyridoxal reductase [Seiridium cupressi]
MASASRVPKPDILTGFGLMGMTWRTASTPDEQAFAAMKAAIAKGATLWSSSEFYVQGGRYNGQLEATLWG